MYRQCRVVVNRVKELETVALSLRHGPARASIGAFGDAGTALAHGPCRHRLGRQRSRRQGRGWWGCGGGRAARRHLGRGDNGRATPVTAAPCRYLLESLAVAYRNDALAQERQLSPEARRQLHQPESPPPSRAPAE